ncbi:hypothetical protein FPSE5266_09531 [Fusarium pseudograminearum]|nr:hypothetical protein FPSE5266_09531 [Fusarium pseudograminearum]
MEHDVVAVAHTFVKRELSPDPGQIPEAPSPKRHADETTGTVTAPVQFPWRECEELEDAERLKVKEKAVIQAEEYCERIRTVLDSVLNIRQDTPEAIMMGLRIVKHWCADRQILVGVEGPTGAGKSSFLGSLLKIPELFPSGQESAATAVIGKASWNWVDDPERRFRAQVFFRTRNEIASEVRSLLKELNRWLGLKASNHDDDDEDTADAISVSRGLIERQLPRVKAVWGMNEEQLLRLAKNCPRWLTYKKAAETILERNATAERFLRQGEVTFNASTAEMLSASIKPFLDSSSSTDGSGNEFAAWPLVSGVHIYAKADILKPGITLVDLPGCGDAVESRSEVAQKVSHTLDVRMVVSPIIRATDEKQGQALMQNGFDEAQMRLRGKMDGRGFCVIASKMDDMKVDSYIAGCPELVHDNEVTQKVEELARLKDEKSALKSSRRELKEMKKQAESQRKKALKAYDKAKKKHKVKLQTDPNASGAHLSTLQAERDEKAEAFTKADKQLDQCEMRQTKNSIEISYTNDWICHRAIQTRNDRVIKRLRTDFAVRQSRLDHEQPSEQPQANSDYVLPIFPVSTRAFWQLESNDTPMPGFPNKTYTGIPAAEKWLHRAILAKRENHLDETLDGYQNLMTMMRIYSATNGQDGDFNFTRSEVETALAGTHAFYTQKMGSKLAEACSEIYKLDPLEQKDRAKRRFLREAQRIVQKWGHKYPDDENNVDKMAYGTYAANLRRNGSTFTSGFGVTYTWIENLAAPILKTLSRDWDKKMNQQLPLIRTPMMSEYSSLFTDYLNEIQRVISEKIPVLAACFSNMRPILESSQRATETQIGDILGTLAEKSAIVALNVANSLEDEMKPTFENALQDVGRGTHARRKEIVQAKMRKDNILICDKMIDGLVEGVAERIAEVPAQLRNTAVQGSRYVQQQLSFLVNNLVENYCLDPVMNANKAEFQNNIRAHIGSWEVGWAEEGNYANHILDMELGIPDTIPEPIIEDAAESEDEATNPSSGSDSDGD